MIKTSLILIGLSALILTACSDQTKEDLGLTRRTPDAFAVVTQAPLSMPPDYHLRPPAPGAPRPQDRTITDQAATALWGKPKPRATNLSRAENMLLNKTNATQAPADIRAVINAETADIIEAETPTARKLLGLGSNAPAPVIDPVAERQRLQNSGK